MQQNPEVSENSPVPLQARAKAITALYGGFFLVLFAAIIVLGIYKYVTSHDKATWNTYETILTSVSLLVALVSIVTGARVMLSDSSTPKVVIPAQDRNLLEELIRAGNEKGIDQYVRLSSLAGTTGTATKLGLTGLPLATVGLTIFFAVGAIFKIDGYLDLAKLTLGAFIGSFVQRNVTGEKIASEGLKIVQSGQGPQPPPPSSVPVPSPPAPSPSPDPP